MKLAMLVTVGVGKDVWEGIAYGIRKRNPEYVLFFTTELSEAKTLPELVNALSLDEDSYECERVPDENEVEECTLAFMEAISRLISHGYEPHELVLDFTSGTKAMSAGLVAAGLEMGVGELAYTAGKRGDDGRVVSGSERAIHLEPNRLAVRRRMLEAVDLFNAFRFETCLDMIAPLPNKYRTVHVKNCVALLTELTQAYRAWDRFDFKTASEYLGNVSGNELVISWQLKGRVERQNRYLRRLLDEDYCYERVIELWQSAEKRAKEDRYDDAMARLYRLMEYVAQLRLYAEHGELETGNMDVEKLNPRLRAQYEPLRQHGKIEIGLKRSYRLLEQLNDPVGIWFYEFFEKDLKKVLGMRNQSILAHGFAPVSADSFETARSCVESLMNKAYPKWDELVKVAKFPQLNASLVIECLGFSG